MINKIYIIESVPDDEIQTGKNLYDNIIVPFDIKYSSKISHSYLSVNSKPEFLNQISEIERNANSNDEIIIHIEVHANDTLMGLKNDEVISWNELTELLIPINRITKNKLHLNIVACFGMHVGLSIDLKRTAPYKSYISALEKINPREITADNNIVYEKIIQYKVLYKAFEEFYKLKPDSKFKIKDVITVLEFHLKPILPLFLNSSLTITKSFFDPYLNIDIDLKTLQESENKIGYILKLFTERFTYYES